MNKKDMSLCTLCPRKCGADRSDAESVHSPEAAVEGKRRSRIGVCGAGSKLKVARAGLHLWEEPCISGRNGSGTVFFSGCPLKCCFCQNYQISDGNFGKEITIERLAEIFLELQGQGAHNINLVNPTHYVPWVKAALELIKDRLHIPIVYNCGGYESVSSLQSLEGYVDIYLPDLKYISPYLSHRYSSASDYFDRASEAILEMFRQTGPIVFDRDGMLQRGLIVRHLVLPGGSSDSLSVFQWLARALPSEEILVSLMSQYTPYHRSTDYPEINRRLLPEEYERVAEQVQLLGFQGYFQESDSAREEYTPPFDLSGV